MNAGLAITVYLAASLISGTVAGAVANHKRRHHGFWTTGAFLFPPLLLVLLVLGKGRYVRQRPATAWEEDEGLDRSDRF
jgi:hypothetical protein